LLRCAIRKTKVKGGREINNKKITPEQSCDRTRYRGKNAVGEGGRPFSCGIDF